MAIEPNQYMHRRLQDAAHRHGVHLDLRERMAEQTGPARRQRRHRDLFARALLRAGSGGRARRDSAHPAPRRHLPVPRARGGRGRHADPRRPTDPSPPVGLDLRGLLVRTRPGAVRARGRVRERRRWSATASTPRSSRSTPTSPASRTREARAQMTARGTVVEVPERSRRLEKGRGASRVRGAAPSCRRRRHQY